MTKVKCYVSVQVTYLLDNQVSKQSKIPRVAKLLSVNMPKANNYLNYSLKIFMV